MCHPAIIIGTMVAAGGYSAYSQYQQGVASKKYYDYQADVANQEAQLALDVGKQRSDLALEASRKQSNIIQDVNKIEGKQLAAEGAQFNASQRAALAALGVSGVTAEALTVDSFNKQKLDEANLRYNADLRSYESLEGGRASSYEALTNADQQAWYSRTLAGQYKYAGHAAKQAGKTKALGTLLGTAASVAMIGAGSPGPKTTKGSSARPTGRYGRE